MNLMTENNNISLNMNQNNKEKIFSNLDYNPKINVKNINNLIINSN